MSRLRSILVLACGVGASGFACATAADLPAGSQTAAADSGPPASSSGSGSGGQSSSSSGSGSGSGAGGGDEASTGGGDDASTGGGAPDAASGDDADAGSNADGSGGSPADAGGGDDSAAEAGAGGSVLLVVGNDPDPSPVSGMLAALASAGLTVEQLNTSVTPLTLAAAAGKGVVIINPNTPRANVPATFKDVPVPVIVSKDGPSTTLMMATTDSSTDPAEMQITIIAPGDPLAAGFPMGDVTVYPKGNRVIFGSPGPGAKAVATVKGSPSEIAIYYYPAGATMAGGFKAPAKRVGFFWHRTSDTTPDGRKLFLAAVQWALSP
jgi:hypothetical protein